jgi:hypothetical protein
MGLGGLLYSAQPQSPDTTPWTPISEPIQLRVGSITAPQFRAERNTTYYIFIESQATIGLHRLECLLGMVDRQKHTTSCPDAPEVIDISWSVSQDGHLAAQGSSQSTPYGYYTADTVAREIGQFQAERGRTYSVTVDVRRNGQELDPTNPKLQVERNLGGGRADEALASALYVLTNLLRGIGSALFIAAGLLTLILPPLVSWCRRVWPRRNDV